MPSCVIIGGGGATLTYVSSVRDTTGATNSHNFSLDCGAGGGVAVAICCGNNVTFSAVTIGGQSATIHVTQAIGGTNAPIGIASATGCPSGTQTITVTTVGNALQWDCFVYVLSGAGSNTPTATGSDAHAIGGDSGNLSNVANGCTLGITQCGNGGAVTWTELTKDAELGAGVARSASAHENFISANASLAWSTSFGGSGNQTGAAWASWGP